MTRLGKFCYSFMGYRYRLLLYLWIFNFQLNSSWYLQNPKESADRIRCRTCFNFMQAAHSVCSVSIKMWRTLHKIIFASEFNWIGYFRKVTCTRNSNFTGGKKLFVYRSVTMLSTFYYCVCKLDVLITQCHFFNVCVLYVYKSFILIFVRILSCPTK
jgi:hypothetical protein